MKQTDFTIKYGKSESLPDQPVTPGAIYFTRNDVTGQGEIFYDTPDENEPKRFSVIGGGIYIGEEELPVNYNIKINPNGISTTEAYYDEENGEYVGGIMSAEDKKRLDLLWKYLGNLQIKISSTVPDTSISQEVDTITIVLPE